MSPSGTPDTLTPASSNASGPSGSEGGEPPIPVDPPEPAPTRSGGEGDHGIEVALRLMSLDTRPPLRQWLEPKLALIARAVGLRTGFLTVAVVNNCEMAGLNSTYHGTAATTDVLTFDLRDLPGRGPVEADIVVCLDEAQRQATLRGHDVRLEILLYAVHGLLHLLGYDDREPTNASKMHQLEDVLCQVVNLPPVYATEGSETEPLFL